MTSRRWNTKWFAGLMALLAIWFLIGAAMNRTAISAVNVQLKPGVEEPGDHNILGIGAKDKLPDYELRIRDGDDWHTVGIHHNTSAVGGLKYSLTNPWPLRRVDEIRFIEVDHLENDILEQLPLSARKLSGKAFEFEIVESSSWATGTQWFWDTAIGKAVLLGITLGFAIIIVARFGL